jgi:hypothetical protein
VSHGTLRRTCRLRGVGESATRHAISVAASPAVRLPQPLKRCSGAQQQIAAESAVDLTSRPLPVCPGLLRLLLRAAARSTRCNTRCNACNTRNTCYLDSHHNTTLSLRNARYGDTPTARCRRAVHIKAAIAAAATGAAVRSAPGGEQGWRWPLPQLTIVAIEEFGRRRCARPRAAAEQLPLVLLQQRALLSPHVYVLLHVGSGPFFPRTC